MGKVWRKSVTMHTKGGKRAPSGSVRVLTDPILRTRLGPLTRITQPPDPSLWQDVDVVLISHSHWDHLDYGSLKKMGYHVPLIARIVMASDCITWTRFSQAIVPRRSRRSPRSIE